MTTAATISKQCMNCKPDGIVTCDGCYRLFCSKHIEEHRQKIYQQIHNIEQQNYQLKKQVSQRVVDQALTEKINAWEKGCIDTIKSTAELARIDLQRLCDESKKKLINITNKLSDDIHIAQMNNQYTEVDLDRLKKQFEQLRSEVESSFNMELIEIDELKSIRLIKIKSSENKENNVKDSSFQDRTHGENSSSQMTSINVSPSNPGAAPNKLKPSISTDTASSQSSLYPSLAFGLNQSTDQKIQKLFKQLMLLKAMDKTGPMSGSCSEQTYQMERFLTKTFGFKNKPDQYIVQGVKSFELQSHPRTLQRNGLIRFPTDTDNAFHMSVDEIINWQRSYKVYADKNIRGMTKEFLQRALQGKSGDGEEAFRMKFVVRISTCPILMEFDAKVIPRGLEDDWPRRIKLVSVTGIDFAGRKHDVSDILRYVSNWKEVFEVDKTKNLPALANERDFLLKKEGPPGQLNEERLLKDLIYMARLRLQACDEEGVEIVVETGIGLGVFAGAHIRIDDKVRITSALAIRTVLEQYGSSFKNIRAIVFALPVIDVEKNIRHGRDTFSAFIEQFQEPPYNGPIPVLIADQDMHRLTVTIARRGFNVSELNPADSHGVFGEYWQNRGPAVEEKLALTTVGLLVQHHLINPYVTNVNNYYLV